MILLLQIGTTGIIAGVVFFLVVAGAAFIAFKMLKKTVKMAFRMVIVAVILLIALVGGTALLFFGSGGKSSPTKPATTRSPR